MLPKERENFSLGAVQDRRERKEHCIISRESLFGAFVPFNRIMQQYSTSTYQYQTHDQDIKINASEERLMPISTSVPDSLFG